MNRIQHTTAKATQDSPTITGTLGYFTAGNPGGGVPATVVPFWFLNQLQEELMAVIVNIGGLTPAHGTEDQLADALGAAGAMAMVADVADTTQISTTWTRAVIASTICRADEARSVAVAGNALLMSGDRSFGAAGDGCEVRSGCTNAATIASRSSDVSNNATNAAIMASDACAWGSGYGARADETFVAGCYQTTVDGERSVALGSQDATVSGSNSAAVASDGVVVTGDTGTQGIATLACHDVEFLTNAGDADPTTWSAAVACSGAAGWGFSGSTAQVIAGFQAANARAHVRGSYSAIMASQYTLTMNAYSMMVCSRNASHNHSYTLGGGYDGTDNLTPATAAGHNNLTWRIGSISGNIDIDGTLTETGADYAELWENAEEGVIPLGTLVAHAEANPEQIAVAPAGSVPCGVISGTAGVIGNAAANGWAGKYERGEYAERILDQVDMVSWPELRAVANQAELDAWEARYELAATKAESTRIKAEDAREAWALSMSPTRPEAERQAMAEARAMAYKAHKVAVAELDAAIKARPARQVEVTRAAYDGPEADAPTPIPEDAKRETLEIPRVSKDYDPARDYTPRIKRPAEWSVVGHLGKCDVRAVKGVKAGDYLEPGPNGRARKAAQPTGVRVLAVRPEASGPAAIARCFVNFKP